MPVKRPDDGDCETIRRASIIEQLTNVDDDCRIELGAWPAAAFERQDGRRRHGSSRRMNNRYCIRIKQ